METKKGSPSARRMKRAQKPEDNSWDCTVCTYRNTAEAFKCLMCDVRKGTSTRKPRLNPQLVPQVFGPASVKSKREPKERDKNEQGRKTRPRLKNVDRSSPVQEKVTVNNVTVIITEFRPKRPSMSSSPSLDCFEGASSSSNSNASFSTRGSFHISNNYSSDSNNSD